MLSRTSYRAEAYARAAERLGVRLTLGTDLPLAFARLGLETIALDLGDPERAAETAVARGLKIDGALGTDEASALVAARILGRLGLPSNDPEGVFAARDKVRLRERLARAGIPQPWARVLEPGADPGSLSGEVVFPCVAKPPMLSGSQGVIRADDARTLELAVHRIRRILERHPSPWRHRSDFHRLLIEDYVEGPEVAVEALLHDGRLEEIAIFDKPDDLAGPFFEETLYVTPSRLPAATQHEVLEVTARAAAALGLVHGPVHAELRLPEGRPHVIEIAARSIGGLCSKTLELMATNLEELLLAHAVGLPRSMPVAKQSGAAGVMMLPIPRSGVLRRVDGVERAAAVPGIESVEISTRVGGAVHALPEGSSYLGFLFARGDTPDQVERSLRLAHAELAFALVPLLEIY